MSIPHSERTQDSRIAAALDLAYRIIYPTALNYIANPKSRDRLLAQAVLDLNQRLHDLERRMEKGNS